MNWRFKKPITTITLSYRGKVCAYLCKLRTPRLALAHLGNETLGLHPPLAANHRPRRGGRARNCRERLVGKRRDSAPPVQLGHFSLDPSALGELLLFVFLCRENRAAGRPRSEENAQAVHRHVVVSRAVTQAGRSY